MKRAPALRCFILLAMLISYQLYLAEAESPEKSQAPTVVTAVPESLKLDPFYKKYIDAWGIPVVSSDKVADEALLEVKYLIKQVLSARTDILEGMAKRDVRIIVIGVEEQVTDIPEYSHMDEYWNRRARGFGGQTTSCGEENLLNYEGDRYVGENIFLHEFAHCIHSHLRRTEPGFQEQLNSLYKKAKAQGLFDNTYAGINATEYWAEGVQGYLDCNRQSRTGKPDRVHNHVNTREELQAYDPNLFEFIDDTFGNIEWRYIKYIDRQKMESEESDKEEEIKEKVSKVTAPPESIKLNPFYTKYIDAWGIPVLIFGQIASSKISFAHAGHIIMMSISHITNNCCEKWHPM
jgi:alpha-glucosidase